jgi:hypothetical protein
LQLSPAACAAAANAAKSLLRCDNLDCDASITIAPAIQIVAARHWQLFLYHCKCLALASRAKAV